MMVRALRCYSCSPLPGIAPVWHRTRRYPKRPTEEGLTWKRMHLDGDGPSSTMLPPRSHPRGWNSKSHPTAHHYIILRKRGQRPLERIAVARCPVCTWFCLLREDRCIIVLCLRHKLPPFLLHSCRHLRGGGLYGHWRGHGRQSVLLTIQGKRLQREECQDVFESPLCFLRYHWRGSQALVEGREAAWCLAGA